MNNQHGVCIYSPSENIWGGGQIYIENLCRYMNDQGTSTVIATAEQDTFTCPTIPMASVSTSKKKRLLSSISFAKELKQQGFKVVMLNDLSSLWLAPVFRLYGLKVTALLHLYLQQTNAEGLGHSFLEYHLLRFTSRFCHKIFSVNKDNIKAFPVDITFVGNFISPWFFGPSQSEKKYDLAIISRLSKQKNIPLFVKLIENLNAISDKPVNALILGRGEEQESTQALIKQKGLEQTIELCDWAERKDLPNIYDSIRCFAITSHHEGFATTLLEAHARGVPAITTKSAGFCAEFVEGFGGVTGLTFTKKDVANTKLQSEVLNLISNASEFYQPCITKAKVFSEDKVLGVITKHVVDLL